jgi:hypothetical protein
LVVLNTLFHVTPSLHDMWHYLLPTLGIHISHLYSPTRPHHYSTWHPLSLKRSTICFVTCGTNPHHLLDSSAKFGRLNCLQDSSGLGGSTIYITYRASPSEYNSPIHYVKCIVRGRKYYLSYLLRFRWINDQDLLLNPFHRGCISMTHSKRFLVMDGQDLLPEDLIHQSLGEYIRFPNTILI